MLLLAHAQHQGLDATDDQVGRERVEGRAVDFPVVPDLGHQGFAAAHQAAEHVAMAAEKLGRAVDHHIHAQRQGVLVQGVAKVLSATTSAPTRLAAATRRWMSRIFRVGLVGVSRYSTRQPLAICASISA